MAAASGQSRLPVDPAAPPARKTRRALPPFAALGRYPRARPAAGAEHPA